MKITESITIAKAFLKASNRAWDDGVPGLLNRNYFTLELPSFLNCGMLEILMRRIAKAQMPGVTWGS